jgi:hypothetical protein
MTDPDARYKKVTLSRHQIERLAVFMALQRNVESVTIEETHESGIGTSHAAIYHGHDDLVDDITDVGNW